MSSALDRLAELVKQAETKTRAQKLGTETAAAAERLRVAEERARVAERRLQEVRPVRLKELDQCLEDEQKLRDLVRKLAQALSHLDPESRRLAEGESVNAQKEIAIRRAAAQAELESVLKESDAAKRELRQARDGYAELRREIDRLLPHLASDYTNDDRLLRDAEGYFPSGQIQALAREIDDGERHFGMLDQREQYAQLKIWIGRFRRLQAIAESGSDEMTDEEVHQLREIFPRLVGISKQFMPGYIEAFSRSFETDWDAYIVESEEQLRLAMENALRNKETEARRRDLMVRDTERRMKIREEGRAALDELKAVIARHDLPDEGVDEFLDTLNRAVSGLGASDAQLIELVRPYVDLLGGKDFRALRRNIERVEPDVARAEENKALAAEFAELRALTRGRRAVMIGGDVREEKRRSLIQVFDFEELEWVRYEDARPVMLRSLEQRVRNRGMDLVLILKEFVGHHVSEMLRPECEKQGIPCLMVEHGYGAAQVADAIQRGLAAMSKLAAAEVVEGEEE